jgi:tRNA pseudouridine13 synthase
MKLRQKPEDFIVEEISSIKPIDKPDGYKIYMLEKTGLETFSLLGYLSKKFRISTRDIGISGMKDKHALTRQYVSMPAKCDVKDYAEKNFALKFLGYANKQIELGDHEQNRFIITVRALRRIDLEKIIPRIESLKQYGVPNYFDSQRFGSAVHKEFIAKYLLSGDIETAMKIYLTFYLKTEPKQTKDDKRNIAENWTNLDRVTVNDNRLKVIIEEYKKTKDWLKTYLRINEQIRDMFFKAYQSYIWNEGIKEMLKKYIPANELYPVDYNMGNVLFFKRMPTNISLPKEFGTIAGNKNALTSTEQDFISIVLKKEGIAWERFSSENLARFNTKLATNKRETIVRPFDFEISTPEADELNSNASKITLKFSLSKGSYATIITKKIFNK